jgi:hypothetical protein
LNQSGTISLATKNVAFLHLVETYLQILLRWSHKGHIRKSQDGMRRKKKITQEEPALTLFFYVRGYGCCG